jgi:murein DD-endopeptidase MepM/ murein hydrolase activator NlpD
MALIVRRFAVTSSPVTHAAKPAVENVHIVAHGETLIGVARRYGVSLPALARANNIEPNARVGVGDRLIVPGVRPIAMTQPASAARPAPKIAQPNTVPADRLASAAPAQSARVATPEAQTTPEPVTKTAEAAGSIPSFRWPVKGRIIAGFGPGSNGVQNDGINLAVPEGTPIKAAEDGVVAYSGNELKGYGNLVLVRHSNGYVTAYAHASELLVKRGDNIRRGQVIAKSGQSGEVGSPQLHFEIRKGSTPVDPLQFLNGA